MSLTLEGVTDILNKSIEIAEEGCKKLTFCPFTSRFHLFQADVSLWPAGEKNVIHAIRKYNELEA